MSRNILLYAVLFLRGFSSQELLTFIDDNSYFEKLTAGRQVGLTFCYAYIFSLMLRPIKWCQETKVVSYAIQSFKNQSSNSCGRITIQQFFFVFLH